jgi:hypothetical protein
MRHTDGSVINVGTNVNDRLYFLSSPNSGTFIAAFYVVIPPGTYTGTTLATALQTRLSAFFEDDETVVYSNGHLTFSGSGVYSFPSHQELVDSAWKARSWDPNLTIETYGYDVHDTRDLNENLNFASGATLKKSSDSGAINVPTASHHVLPLPLGQYTGVGLTSALQAAFQSIAAEGAVVWDEVQGKYTFDCDTPHITVMFPTGDQLRNAYWISTYWPSVGNSPRDFNTQLYFPEAKAFTQTVVTGVVSLMPFRELFLHSSLTNFRTLKGSGEKDALCRVPIDVDYGMLNNFRNFGGQENSIAASSQHFRSISFQWRTFDGYIPDMPQPTSIELCFLDSDPYNLG